MGASSRESLLVAKGVLGPMGGAERDLIRILPSLHELFSVTMATIQPSPELVEVCSSNGIALITPCLLYTSPSPRDRVLSRMPSSA